MGLIGWLNKREVPGIGKAGPGAGQDPRNLQGPAPGGRPRGGREALPEGAAGHGAGMTRIDVEVWGS